MCIRHCTFVRQYLYKFHCSLYNFSQIKYFYVFLKDNELYYIVGGVQKKVVLTVEEIGEILHHHHSNAMGGHSGVNATLNKISNHYYWNGMKEDVQEYVCLYRYICYFYNIYQFAIHPEMHAVILLCETPRKFTYNCYNLRCFACKPHKVITKTADASSRMKNRIMFSCQIIQECDCIPKRFEIDIYRILKSDWSAGNCIN